MLARHVGETLRVGVQDVEDAIVVLPHEIGEMSTERGPGGEGGAAVGVSEEAHAAGMCEDGL